MLTNWNTFLDEFRRKITVPVFFQSRTFQTHEDQVFKMAGNIVAGFVRLYLAQ